MTLLWQSKPREGKSLDPFCNIQLELTPLSLCVHASDFSTCNHQNDIRKCPCSLHKSNCCKSKEWWFYPSLCNTRIYIRLWFIPYLRSMHHRKGRRIPFFDNIAKLIRNLIRYITAGRRSLDKEGIHHPQSMENRRWRPLVFCQTAACIRAKNGPFFPQKTAFLANFGIIEANFRAEEVKTSFRHCWLIFG